MTVTKAMDDIGVTYSTAEATMGFVMPVRSSKNGYDTTRPWGWSAEFPAQKKCMGYTIHTLGSAANVDQDGASRLVGSSGESLSVAAWENSWCSFICDLHQASVEGLLDSSPAQSATAIFLNVMQLLLVLLSCLLTLQENYLCEQTRSKSVLSTCQLQG